jgi:hypothetical protein
MTDSKDALIELLGKIEAGTFKWNAWAKTPLDRALMGKVEDAYYGDLNAAKALHEAVLPDHRARLDVGKKYRAWIITPDNEKFDAYSSNPARAWLIAILKALIADENTNANDKGE